MKPLDVPGLRRPGPPDPFPDNPTADVPEGSPETLFLLGVPLHNLTQADVLDRVLRAARERRPCHIVTSNLDFLLQAWRDPEMHRIHLEADLVLADGMPVVWFSRLFGPPLKERVAGSDLLPRLAELARDHDLSLFAVGGAPGVAEKALKILQERFPGLRVAGCESPPMTPLLQMDDAIVERIRSAKPDIVLVAFGAPKQEKYIRLNAPAWDVPVAIGIGGSLDFIVGAQVRAPRAFQKLGLEWFWRLLRDPRRMFKRYLQDFLFLAGMLVRLLYLRMAPSGDARVSPPPDPQFLSSRGATLVRLKTLRRSVDADRFCREMEPVAERQPMVVDLTGLAWLNSLELGTLSRLARACRKRHHRLFVTGARPRVARLIRVSRLDRYLELTDSLENLLHGINLAKAGTKLLRTGFTRVDHRLHVQLPSEFGRDAVVRIHDLLLAHLRSGEVREVVFDARRMEYIDIIGARFLLASRRMIEREAGRSMWLLGFPEGTLKSMRKEGLDSYRVDRRKTFRREPWIPNDLPPT